MPGKIIAGFLCLALAVSLVFLNVSGYPGSRWKGQPPFDFLWPVSVPILVIFGILFLIDWKK